jgi:hypothetical protein
MSVTTTQARNEGFVPSIWANRVLDRLRAFMVLGRLATRDTSFAPAQPGEKLIIPYPGQFVAKRKRAGVNTSVQDPTGGTKVEVTLKEHRSIDFIVEDVAEAQANLSIMDRYVNNAAMAMAEQIEADGFAVYTGYLKSAGTFGTPLNRATIVNSGRLLTDAKIPRAGRAVVMSTADEEALKNDTTLAAYFANSNPAAIAEGAIGRLDGADLYPSQLTPRGATVTVNATGGTFKVSIPTLDADDVIVRADSPNITYSAGLTAASIQTTLENMTGVGAGNISVTGANGGPFLIRPIGALAGSSLDITATNVALTGGAGTVAAVPANIGLAVGNEAMILMTRPFKPIPDGSGVRSSTIVDQASGFAIRVLYQYDMNARGTRVGFDTLYGWSRLRDDAAIILRS